MIRRTTVRLDLDRTGDDAWRVQATVRRGDRVMVRKEMTHEGGGAGEAIAIALGASEVARYRRSAVVVGLGSSLARYKMLRGLPPLATDSALSDAVRENASRFFLRNGVPIVTSTVSRDTRGTVWGAAAEQSLLDAVQRGCTVAGYRLSTIVPTEHGAANGMYWTPSVDMVVAAAARRRRYVTWSITGLVLMAIGLIGPGVIAHIAAARSQRTYHHYALQARAADSLSRQLVVVSSGLNEAVSVLARHRSAITLLAQITQTLPKTHALTSFTIDSAGGTVVVLAPHAGEALSAMAHMPGVVGPEIVGPVTQEALRNAIPNNAEKATIHFRLATTGAAR